MIDELTLIGIAILTYCLVITSYVWFRAKMNNQTVEEFFEDLEKLIEKK